MNGYGAMTAKQEDPTMVPFGGALEPPDTASPPAPDVSSPDAMPESILGSEVPAGQPIPADKMGEAGKKEFHETMRGFEQRDAANRGSMLALDPSDPDYLKKLAAHQAQEGMLKSEQSHFQKMHPWGSQESAHPGLLGKIGHVASEIGNVAGSAVVPNLVDKIPGTRANLGAKERAGEQEESEAIKNEGEAATAAHTEAEVPAVEAGVDKTKADTEHTKQETKNLQNPQLKTIQDQYSAAVAAAQARGIDPNTDPKVKQLADSITSLQKEPATKEEKLEQQYQDAIESGDHEKAERLLKVMSDVAKAKQAPQRPPQTLVVLPNGQTEAVKPGMTLPEGTQNIGGFASQGRPTAQMRNVSAQAQIAIEGIPQVVSEIDRLKDQLGPVSGRWNEFMQGKVGMENPEMAGLRADLLMVSSAVALAHARGRLPENLRQEFDSAINSPKQDPENLKSVLNHIMPWMQRMGNMTDQPGGKGGGEALKPPSEAKQGMKWQHKTGTDGKVQWRQVPQ